MRWLREYAAAAMQVIQIIFTAATQVSIRTNSDVENRGFLAAGGSVPKGGFAANSSSLMITAGDSAAKGASVANRSSVAESV